MNHIRQSTQEKALRFTKEEVEIAKQTDLPDLLEYLGYSVKRIGNYYTTREMDSIRIKNRRTWTRYSTRQRGDAITFLQEFCGKSFVEAVDFLLAYHGRTRDSPAMQRPEPVPEERPPFALPPAWHDQRRVFAYLRGRGIAPQVIEGFIGAGLRRHQRTGRHKGYKRKKPGRDQGEQCARTISNARPDAQRLRCAEQTRRVDCGSAAVPRRTFRRVS